MSETNLKVVAGTDVPAADEADTEAAERYWPTEELPPLHIDPTSFDARVAGVEMCSVVRELAKHNSSMAACEVERAKAQGGLSPEEEMKALRDAWEAQWERRPEDLDEYVRLIRRKAVKFIGWGDIGQVWNASPRDAVELWARIRLEARDEFISGHYGARALETMSWQHEAWRRAQYLAVRDGLVEEWRPRGASEFMLIDCMTQAYVMQIEWTEKATTRMQGAPRQETYAYQEWKRYRKAAEPQWAKGDWDVPYQREADAIEQAFRMADMCQKTFQRALRQLANVRLIRAKTARTKRRDRAKTIRAVKVA